MRASDPHSVARTNPRDHAAPQALRYGERAGTPARPAHGDAPARARSVRPASAPVPSTWRCSPTCDAGITTSFVEPGRPLGVGSPRASPRRASRRRAGRPVSPATRRSTQRRRPWPKSVSTRGTPAVSCRSPTSTSKSAGSWRSCSIPLPTRFARPSLADSRWIRAPIRAVSPVAAAAPGVDRARNPRRRLRRALLRAILRPARRGAAVGRTSARSTRAPR
jgi:hypothetical protein